MEAKGEISSSDVHGRNAEARNVTKVYRCELLVRSLLGNVTELMMRKEFY